MTTSTVTIWHCDAQLCGATAPEGTKDWTYAIYTHGCPAHGAVIAAHRAKVVHDTRGRGSQETTTWYLRCACGWTPRPDWSKHTAAPLHAQHLAHVHEQELTGCVNCANCEAPLMPAQPDAPREWVHANTGLIGCDNGSTHAERRNTR